MWLKVQRICASSVDKSLRVSCLIYNWPNEKIDFTIPKLFLLGIKPNNSVLSRNEFVSILANRFSDLILAFTHSRGSSKNKNILLNNYYIPDPASVPQAAEQKLKKIQSVAVNLSLPVVTPLETKSESTPQELSFISQPSLH